MKPQHSNQRLLRTGVARNSGRKRTFSNPPGLKLCNSDVLVFGCLRGRDVEKFPGTKICRYYKKLQEYRLWIQARWLSLQILAYPCFLVLSFVGITYVVIFHDVTFRCVAVCCDALQSENLRCQQQPSSFVPQSAPNIWTQAGPFLVERTINQTTEVLLFWQFQLNLDHFR